MAKLIEELADDVGEAGPVAAEQVVDETVVADESERQQREANPGKPKKKQLEEDPDFRAWQTKYDKRQLELQAALDQANRQRQEDAARQAWYEQQLEQLQTRDLDEPSKLAYENQKLKRMLSALQQQKQIEEGRAKIFQRITARFGAVGVPYEVYANANDADEAWDLAADYALKNMPQKLAASAQAKAEKREANEVYLGGNSATADDWEAKAERMFKRKDSIGYARLMLERERKE